MKNKAIGAFYIRNNILNAETLRLANRKTGEAFDRFFVWDSFTDNNVNPNYLLCEPTVSNEGHYFVKLYGHARMKCFNTPFVFNDELQALRILPPQAYFEYIKTLMKPYGE